MYICIHVCLHGWRVILNVNIYVLHEWRTRGGECFHVYMYVHMGGGQIYVYIYVYNMRGGHAEVNVCMYTCMFI